MTIYTIGHSTRSASAFLALLTAYRVAGLADVRTIPRSRRHPHVSREALEVWPPTHGNALLVRHLEVRHVLSAE